MATKLRQKYNVSTAIIQRSQFVPVIEQCNGFTITNTGDTICDVNDQVYHPGVPNVSLGDSRTFGGNQDEIFVGVIKVSFRTPLGAVPRLEIVQKHFIDT